MSGLAVSLKTIFAKKVDEADRARVLAAHFPIAFVRFENFVQLLAEKICLQYHNEPWDFFELSNGGFYMAPATLKQYTVDIPFGRRYSGVLSNDAFGIVCCMYAFCFLADQDEHLVHHYLWLMDYYQAHAELAKIWWAVD